jgi:hypothetical protein
MSAVGQLCCGPKTWLPENIPGRNSWVSHAARGLTEYRAVVTREGLAGLGGHVRYRADFVGPTPRNRPSWWRRRRTVVDPARKSHLMFAEARMAASLRVGAFIWGNRMALRILEIASRNLDGEWR